MKRTRSQTVNQDYTPRKTRRIDQPADAEDTVNEIFDTPSRRRRSGKLVTSHASDSRDGNEGMEGEIGSKDLGQTAKSSGKKDRTTGNRSFLQSSEDTSEVLEGEADLPTNATEHEDEPAVSNGRGTGVGRGRNRGKRTVRAKNTRLVKSRELAGDFSDDEGLAAPEITDGQDEDDVSDAEMSEEPESGNLIPETPVKRKRGRPKGWRKKRTPTPPRDLPPYEHYFFQNRPGGARTSNNTLSSLSLLTHEDFFTAMKKYTDPHQDDMDYLHHLHSRSFDQWLFELEEDYSLCIYGWGSKRLLLSSFTDHIASSEDTPPKTVVVHGFTPSLTVRDIFATIASTIPSLRNQKLGAQPADVLSTILSAFDSSNQPPLYLVVHSIDAPPLRRPAAQSLLARLASSRHVRLIASADTPNFPLLWDSRTRSQYNFLFHDTTTFNPFDAEIGVGSGGGGVVDEFNALLGRSGRRVHGREGVVYVLKSLTESARRLFGLLISEVLSMDDCDGSGNAGPDGAGPDDFEAAVSGTPRRQQALGIELGGVEYRALYRQAVQQLITGNEISFRQLLKEFYDHQMVVSRRDGQGTETLGVPFRREECEAILEDLVIDE